MLSCFSRGRGTEPALPEKYFDIASEKTMLTCKIALANSAHPVNIIYENPGFRALTVHLAGRNEFGFFRLINIKKYFFSFLAAGFCPKNLAFARKIMALPELGGCSGGCSAAPLAPCMARTPTPLMTMTPLTCTDVALSLVCAGNSEDLSGLQ